MYISAVHLKAHSLYYTPLCYDDVRCCRILAVEADTSEMQASIILSHLRLKKKALKSTRKTFLENTCYCLTFSLSTGFSGSCFSSTTIDSKADAISLNQK